MANLISQLVVRLIDGVSGPAKSAAAAIRSLNGVANGHSGGRTVVPFRRS
ncbi:hypothetical protein [Filomicrobium sp.]|nr:hypothetical protein [Filomicrobium sp.]MCV0369531.1 hypothetical protein [Filomicrobium sp.]